MRFKRAQLRVTYSGLSGKTLLEALQDKHGAVTSALESGNLISGSSANGIGASFDTKGGINPAIALQAFDELLDLYDTCVATLTGSPTDAAIYAAMMDRLLPLRSYKTDFSMLRYNT
jgi:hypothetical protein